MEKHQEMYPPTDDVVAAANLKGHATYAAMHSQSMISPDTFWGEQAEALLDWKEKWSADRPVCS